MPSLQLENLTSSIADLALAATNSQNTLSEAEMLSQAFPLRRLGKTKASASKSHFSADRTKGLESVASERLSPHAQEFPTIHSTEMSTSDLMVRCRILC